LIELNLIKNKMESVEFLQFLDLSNLHRLLLSSNKIVHAKSLLKMYFPQILVYDVSSNMFIGERMDAKKIEKIIPFTYFVFGQVDNLYVSIKFKVNLLSEHRKNSERQFN
jgi:hypothetical protein